MYELHEDEMEFGVEGTSTVNYAAVVQGGGFTT